MGFISQRLHCPKERSNSLQKADVKGTTKEENVLEPLWKCGTNIILTIAVHFVSRGVHGKCRQMDFCQTMLSLSLQSFFDWFEPNM